MDKKYDRKSLWCKCNKTLGGVLREHLDEAGSSVHGLQELGDCRAAVTLRVRIRNRVLVELHCLCRQPALVQLLIFIRHQHHIFHLMEEKREEEKRERGSDYYYY